MHFNNIGASNIKSSYVNIKKYLYFSTQDLKYIYKSLKLYWTKLYVSSKVLFEFWKTRISLSAKKLIFVFFSKKIYFYTLDKMVVELNWPKFLLLYIKIFALLIDLIYSNKVW